jgi:4-amino-4-deoxy-L-arabinose transferase-like glycosyltransferase
MGKKLIIGGVLLLAALTASWSLSARALDDHESYVSIAAREMLAGGDWILPTFNGHPRLQKTPLSYWLVAGISKVSGSVNEFTGRLPSAVFAFLSAAAVLYFVNKWLGLRTAALATAGWATTIGYVYWSHSARPEMALAFFTTVCLLSFYTAATSEDSGSRTIFMLVFWVSFALGNLAKGPAPFVYVLLPVGLYIALRKEWRLIPKLLPIWGVIILLVVILPWPLAAAHRVNWNVVIWKKEFFDRLFGEYAAGHYPWHYYLGMVFKYVSPWCILFPVALAAPFYKIWGQKRPLMQYLWLWFVGDYIFLMLSGGKRQHYLLPLVPAMSILTAILIDDMAFVRRAFTPKFAANILRGHVLLFIGFAVALPVFFTSSKTPAYSAAATVWYAVAFSVIFAAAVIISVVLFMKHRPVAAFVVFFCSFGALMACPYTEIMSRISPDRPIKEYALQIAKIVPASDKMVSYKQIPANFIHYFGRTVERVMDESELNDRYQQGCWVVSFGSEMNEMEDTGRYKIVFSKENAEQRGKIVSAGALFHK